MSRQIKFFTIPKCIFEDKNNWQYTLPIFARIRSRADITDRCTISKLQLLNACGYRYYTANKSAGHLNNIGNSLKILQDGDFIYDPVDAITGESITDYNAIKPSTFFEVYINSEMCDTYYGGFIPIYHTLYDKLYREFQTVSGIRFWRLFVVFCFFSMKVWKNWKFNYDITDTNKYLEARYNNPEFYGSTTTHICDELGCEISRTTIDRIIQFLDEHNIVHRRKIGSLSINPYTTLSLGSVYVLDKFGWESEIEGAAKKCRKDREDFFSQYRTVKGGPSDD